MKYANISFLGKEVCNIGDNLQFMSIDYLYSCIDGINVADIIQIPYSELSTWKSDDGEKVFLPINFPFVEYFEKGLCGLFSEDIIPIFLGLTYLKPYLSQDEIEYLKRYEPIGCRDEYTYNTMQKYGIKAWLNGCMTLTSFHRRQKLADSIGKVYLVDVPEEIERRLPQSIISNAEKRTQLKRKEPNDCNINEYVSTRMREYKENAKLMITTRLHCAVPCISMGIPVILILPKVAYRFSWVERILPIYLPDEIGKIDWKVGVSSEVEKIKEVVLENAINIIKLRSNNRVIQMNKCNDISAFYSNRTRRDYYVEGFDPCVDYLKDKYDVDSEFEYAVWGLTWIAEMVCKYITDNYPNAKLVAVFDKNKKIIFQGIQTQKIESIGKENLYNIEVFVTAVAATTAAQRYFREIGKIDKYCLCYMDRKKLYDML